MNPAEAVGKMAKQLAKHGELGFCYEASGCGYQTHRQLTGLGHKCTVGAPSMIPRKPGERIKTDRRDSEKLAILHHSGNLKPVWVPDTTHEALRDLLTARVDASMHLMRARQQLLAFLLRHGRSYPTGRHWTQPPSLLARRSDLSGAGPRHRLPRLPRDRMDRTGETRCTNRKDLLYGFELVAWTSR